MARNFYLNINIRQEVVLVILYIYMAAFLVNVTIHSSPELKD
jgi:hypothetical protein